MPSGGGKHWATQVLAAKASTQASHLELHNHAPQSPTDNYKLCCLCHARFNLRFHSAHFLPEVDSWRAYYCILQGCSVIPCILVLPVAAKLLHKGQGMPPSRFGEA